MRLPILTTLLFLLTGLLFDILIVRMLNKSNHRRLSKAYIIPAVFMAVELIVAISLPRNDGSDNTLLAVMWMLYAYFSFYISKIVFLAICMLGRVPILWHGHKLKYTLSAATIIAVAVFATMWWAALINRFNLEVERINLYFDNLPKAYDGMTIVQFSDIHLGTYGNSTRYVAEMVDSINALNPDIIFFTGDIVNRHTKELEPFTSVLSQLHAPLGVYSVLGNHDYGDYSNWPSPEAKAENMLHLLKLQNDMGWKMLNNDHTTLHAGGDSIVVVGVENWGEPPFSIYGNLKEAYPTPSDSTFKILLTHNPMHWIQEIADNPEQRYDLTLSGHTHAMQIEIGHWSPSKYRYPTYDGLYQSPDSLRHIYVSRGIGTVGMPARIGATPALTHITLHRKQQP